MLQGLKARLLDSELSAVALTCSLTCSLTCLLTCSYTSCKHCKIGSLFNTKRTSLEHRVNHTQTGMSRAYVVHSSPAPSDPPLSHLVTCCKCSSRHRFPPRPHRSTSQRVGSHTWALAFRSYPRRIYDTKGFSLILTRGRARWLSRMFAPLGLKVVVPNTCRPHLTCCNTRPLKLQRLKICTCVRLHRQLKRHCLLNLLCLKLQLNLQCCFRPQDLLSQLP